MAPSISNSAGPANTDRRSKGHRPYAPRMAAEQRREQLLDATLGVIVEQGYAHVSIEAVARAAGVTRPVVYDHFGRLGDLLRALIDREERYSLAQLDTVLPDDLESLPPATVLSRSVTRFLDAVASRPATWTLILLPLEGTPEIVRQHVESNRAKMLARMEAVVRWAISRRGPRPPAGSDGVDVELAARAILGLAEDAGRMVLTDPERYSPQRPDSHVGWCERSPQTCHRP
jgi:AcrR family transcriptional regulator